MGVYTIYFNSLDEELDRHDNNWNIVESGVKKISQTKQNPCYCCFLEE